MKSFKNIGTLTREVQVQRLKLAYLKFATAD